jgi:hypothetical protein
VRGVESAYLRFSQRLERQLDQCARWVGGWVGKGGRSGACGHGLSEATTKVSSDHKGNSYAPLPAT